MPTSETRRLRALGTALALVLAPAAAATACGERDERTPDDTLVYVSSGRHSDLDPRFALTAHDTKLSRLVAPGLMTVDNERVEPQLELAASLEQVDDVTWEATLRPDARFSTGEPVTAADVVYTFESAMDPAIGSLYRRAWEERFARLEAVDERTVRFHLKVPVATLPSDLDFGIISKTAALAAGGRFAGGGVIGAGSFLIASFHPERVVLVPNPHAVVQPAMPRVEVVTIRDANARLLVMVGGDGDLTQNSVRLDLVRAVSERDDLEVRSGPSAILSYLMFQTEDPILSDVRVRRAIAYAVDRSRIIEAKLHGRAVPATGLLPPMHWAYEGDVARYGYDPERAMRLLDEAGYPDPDGPGGQPRLRLQYKTSADQFRLTIARIVAAQLAEVGIEIDVRSFEFSTFYEDVKRGNFQLASMQTGDITEPDYYYAYFHSSRIPTPENLSPLNRWRYRSGRIDELTERGRRVADRDERRRIYADVQRILADDLPIVPLWHENNIAIVRRGIEGFELLPSARLRGLVTATKR